MDYEEALLLNASRNHFNESDYDGNSFGVPKVVITIYICIKSMILFAGLLSNAIMIFIIAANHRFHTKRYLLILNVAVSDVLMLLVYSESFEMILLYNESFLTSPTAMCVFNYLEETLQLNTLVFLAILATNSLMKNERVKLKNILIVTYSFIVLTNIVNGFLCSDSRFPLTFFIWILLFTIFEVVIMVKSCNSCFKSAVKKDPLSHSTKFRFDFVRIYCLNWMIVYVSVFFIELFTHFYHSFIFFLYMKLFGLLTSGLLLIYLIRMDRHFGQCFWSVLRCKKIGWNEDATVIYAEELNEDDDNVHPTATGSVHITRNPDIC